MTEVIRGRGHSTTEIIKEYEGNKGTRSFT